MSVFVILNHSLTAEQRNELEERFGKVVELSPEQQAIWSQVPAEGDRRVVSRHIWPILRAIRLHEAVVCQGEFTATLEIHSWARYTKKPFLVACSKRETEETTGEDGAVTKKAVFRHVQFREVSPF